MDTAKCGCLASRHRACCSAVPALAYLCTFLHRYIFSFRSIHIYIYTYIYICIYTYVYIYVYAHTYVHIYIRTCMHVYTCIHVHTHKHTHMWTQPNVVACGSLPQSNAVGLRASKHRVACKRAPMW